MGCEVRRKFFLHEKQRIYYAAGRIHSVAPMKPLGSSSASGMSLGETVVACGRWIAGLGGGGGGEPEWADGAERGGVGALLRRAGAADSADGTRFFVDGFGDSADGTRFSVDGSGHSADGTRHFVDGFEDSADGTRRFVDGSGRFVTGFGPWEWPARTAQRSRGKA